MNFLPTVVIYRSGIKYITSPFLHQEQPILIPFDTRLFYFVAML